MKRHPLLSFFALSFAITWGICAVMILFADTLAQRFGEFDYGSPFWRTLFQVAVYAPAIAAFTVIGVVKGGAGIRAYLSRIFRWRVGIRWYIVVLLGTPMLFAAARLLMIVLGKTVPGYGFDVWWGWLPLVLLGLVVDPGGIEELGWRGFALPMLQRRFSALSASVILGVIWAVWHLPAFLISGTTQSSASVPMFIVFAVTLSIIMTFIYNGTGGSVLLLFLTHALVNSTLGQHLVGVELGYSTIIAGVVVVALLLGVGWRRLGSTKVTEPLDIPWDEVEPEAPSP